jgi:hypothetical protein
MSKWHFLLFTYNEKYYYEQLLFPQNSLEIQNTLHKHPPVLSLKKGEPPNNGPNSNSISSQL